MNHSTRSILRMGAVLLTILFPDFASAFQSPTPTPNAAPALGIPNKATAPLAGSPIQVESCYLDYDGNALVATTGKLEIKFTNEGSVVADLIRFKVTWEQDHIAYIRDVGTFASGIEISHKFRETEGETFSPLLTHLNVKCSVESAHFTDGSVWTAAVSTP